jgi:hypothetical protein
MRLDVRAEVAEIKEGITLIADEPCFDGRYHYDKQVSLSYEG